MAVEVPVGVTRSGRWSPASPSLRVGRPISRLWALVFGILATLTGVVLAPTTTANATIFTYDAPALARVGAHPFTRAEASPTQLSGSREVSASLSVEDRGATTTSSRSFIATEAATPRETMFHYTDEAGEKGILDSGQLNPSLKSVNPADARYGNGQYLSEVQPGSMSCAQLSRCFLGQPFQGSRFTNYVEIDVTGLDIIKARPGVFVNPSETPLDLAGRIVSWGRN